MYVVEIYFFLLHRQGDVAVLFFGGHAVERNGERYFFGIRADRESEEGTLTAGVSLSWILSLFPSGSLLLLFIDACRNK